MKQGGSQGPESPPAVSALGGIDPDVVYRVDEAKLRMGWRDAAFRAACQAGLKVHKSGKRAYVRGSDLIAFVTKGESPR